MEDIKRLSAFMVASSMFMANMTCALVSAEEITDDDGGGSSISISIDDVGEDTELNPADAENSDQQTEESTETEEFSDNEESSDSEIQEMNNDEVMTQENTGHSISSELPEEHATETENNEEPQPPESVESEEASSVNRGKGDIEGLVNTKVFQVTLPVQNNALDYVADPQGLIRKTNAAKHPDSVYDENSNVYFNNGQMVTGDGRTVTGFSKVSNPLTVVNKSSSAVTVVARVSAYYEQGAQNPVAIAGSREWEGVSRPSICLSVIRSDDGSEVVLSQREKVISASIAGCPEAYKYIYGDDGNGEKNYGYCLISDEELKNVESPFKSFSLQMTGECNSEGEWKAKEQYDFPSTTIVWNVGFAVSAKPYVSEDYFTVAFGDEIRIPYSLGLYDAAATGLSSAEFTAKSGENVQISGNGDYFSTTEDEIVLSSVFASYARSLGGGSLKLVFNDPAETSADITLDGCCLPYLDETEYTVSKNDRKLSVIINLGEGEKAATGISSVKFENNEFFSSAYITLTSTGFTLNASAVKKIQDRNGGRVYVTFDDAAHTKCSFKVNISD